MAKTMVCPCYFYTNAAFNSTLAPFLLDEERLKTSGLEMNKSSGQLFSMLGANLRAKARQ